jgi:hypothetical protein
MAKLTREEKLYIQELQRQKAKQEAKIQAEIAKATFKKGLKNISTKVETVMEKGKPKIKVTEYNRDTGKTEVYLRPTDKAFERAAMKEFKQKGSPGYEGTIQAPKGKAALDTVKFLFGK